MRLLAAIRTAFRRRPTFGLPAAGSMFREIMEHSSDLILRVGADGGITYASPAAETLLGWRPEEMVGQRASAFVVEEDLPIILAAMVLSSQGEDHGEPRQVRSKRKDGDLVWVECRGATIKDPVTGEPGDVVVIIRDISERKALEERLASMAMTDALTGIANRRAFDEALLLEWKRARRTGSSLSLLLLDIDCFKSFNDRLGHQVGDDCLRAVATAVAGLIRRPDHLVARYGGEELSLILLGAEMAGALQMAEQVRAAIEGLRIPHPQGGYVTASVGAATATAMAGGSTTMPEALLQAADTALYKAKHKGRNRVESSFVLTADSVSRAA